MRRTTFMQVAGTVGCIALALAPFFSGVRHAGYYVAVAAFLEGLILGLRAVLVVFALSFTLGVGGYIYETASPSSGEDQRALVVLWLTLVPAGVSLPVLVGVALRSWLGWWLITPSVTTAKRNGREDIRDQKG